MTAEMMVAVGLVLIVLLGASLRFYKLGEHSIGNTYYAATVQSMLTSWHNFFFAAFEPGGSVTVDKPPLGFWVQAVSAYFLGMNGFALAFPQALAGAGGLALAAFAAAVPLGAKFTGLLALYLLVSFAYSMHFKKVLILDVIEQMNMLEPKPNIRVHAKTPDRLLQRIVEMLANAQGSPFLINFDENAMAGLRWQGLPEERLWDYAPVGCLEQTVSHRAGGT